MPRCSDPRSRHCRRLSCAGSSGRTGPEDARWWTWRLEIHSGSRMKVMPDRCGIISTAPTRLSPSRHARTGSGPRRGWRPPKDRARRPVRRPRECSYSTAWRSGTRCSSLVRSYRCMLTSDSATYSSCHVRSSLISVHIRIHTRARALPRTESYVRRSRERVRRRTLVPSTEATDIDEYNFLFARPQPKTATTRTCAQWTHRCRR